MLTITSHGKPWKLFIDALVEERKSFDSYNRNVFGKHSMLTKTRHSGPEVYILNTYDDFSIFILGSFFLCAHTFNLLLTTSTDVL